MAEYIKHGENGRDGKNKRYRNVWNHKSNVNKEKLHTAVIRIVKRVGYRSGVVHLTG